MQLQLLPSTFDENGCASMRQHLSCFIIDDYVAIDAGSLAMATTSVQKNQIRDVILSHAHLDHIAGLPLFVDDLFANLSEPIRVYATREVIDVLEADIFNWDVYPRFSELKNNDSPVLEYIPFEIGKEFSVKHLKIKAVRVNHKVPAVGFIISDGKSTIAMSSDTAEMNSFWENVNQEKQINACLIECAFPNELNELAKISHHLTPNSLKQDLRKLKQNCPIYVINIKPMYRDEVVRQLDELGIENLKVLNIGKNYLW